MDAHSLLVHITQIIEALGFLGWSSIVIISCTFIIAQKVAEVKKAQSQNPSNATIHKQNAESSRQPRVAKSPDTATNIAGFVFLGVTMTLFFIFLLTLN